MVQVINYELQNKSKWPTCERTMRDYEEKNHERIRFWEAGHFLGWGKVVGPHSVYLNQQISPIENVLWEKS